MAGESQRCCLCGVALRDENAYRLPKELKREGHSPYCLKCQPKVYDARAAQLGIKLAMFVCCLEFNMPYLPELFEESAKIRRGTKMNPWESYTVALAKKGCHKGEMQSFRDGLTDIRKAFDGNTDTWHIDDYEPDEGEKESQLDRWGDGPVNAPYSLADYSFLDDRYNALANGKAYLSPQTDMTIKQICEYHLLAKRAMDRGEYDNAKKINSMIKELMESEQLRKKDELPQDTVRLDDIVQALERKGIPIMDYEELSRHLANHAMHKSYPYTRDAADQMLLQIRNTTARNEGVAEVASLPPQFRIKDELGEFAPEPDEQEKKIYKELELTRMDGK